MKKKKGQKKKKHIIHTNISTKIGVLIILSAAIPVAMMANFFQNSQRQEQSHMVEGLAIAPHEGIMSDEGTSSGIFHCPPGSTCYPYPSLPFPSITCIPRPPCLVPSAGKPRCYIAEPKMGWCPLTSPTPPTGCFVKRICMMESNGKIKTVCPTSNPNCTPCKTYFICPSGTPFPKPSCHPEPTCDPKKGILCRHTEPCSSITIGPSQGQITSLSPQTFPSQPGTSIGNFFTNFFKSFFSRQ